VSEWIECPRCEVVRRLKRGEPNECASCGWLFAAGETEQAIEHAREWEVVRALESTEKQRNELLDTLKTLTKQIDEWEQAVQAVVGKRQYPWRDLEDARRAIAKAEGLSCEGSGRAS
jgi:septal ring factor EnvC (AmiA/AmiB activator)